MTMAYELEKREKEYKKKEIKPQKFPVVPPQQDPKRTKTTFQVTSARTCKKNHRNEK